jgi:hypothetical protein
VEVVVAAAVKVVVVMLVVVVIVVMYGGIEMGSLIPDFGIFTSSTVLFEF